MPPYGYINYKNINQNITSPHINTMVDLFMRMGYSSACGAQLMSNISQPEGIGYMQATYQNISTYKEYHLTPHLAVKTR